MAANKNIKNAEKKAKKALQDAEAKFAELKKNVHTQIRKEPEKAVVVAAALGAAVGAVTMLALSRRKKQE